MQDLCRGLERRGGIHPATGACREHPFLGGGASRLVAAGRLGEHGTGDAGSRPTGGDAAPRSGLHQPIRPMTVDVERPILEARQLSKAFPNAHEPLVVLDQVSLAVRSGSFVCVVGPSGCGKTTLLRLLAGLTRATSGEVIFEGAPLLHPRRRIGFVFQESNLMPWRNALDNIRLPLELQR